MKSMGSMLGIIQAVLVIVLLCQSSGHSETNTTRSSEAAPSQKTNSETNSLVHVGTPPSSPDQDLSLRRLETNLFAGTVIFSTNQISDVVFLKNYYSPLWNPPTNIVAQAVAGLPNFLRYGNTGRSESGYHDKLIENLPKTVCQVVGVTYDGRNGILLNCLRADAKWSQRWQEGFIKVSDGGPNRCWSVVYLPESQVFTNLNLNVFVW